MPFETIRILSDREKAAITYGVFESIRDWKILYLIARGLDSKDITGQSLIASASKWKNTPAVKQFYADQIAKYNARIAAGPGALQTGKGKKKEGAPGAVSEENDENGQNAAGINFTDRAQLLEFLNTAANSMNDEKRRTEYIKLIAELLQFKDENKKDNSIQRFYIPVSCDNCALYQAQKQALTPPGLQDHSEKA